MVIFHGKLLNNQMVCLFFPLEVAVITSPNLPREIANLAGLCWHQMCSLFG
jgi:hypothetical protein